MITNLYIAIATSIFGLALNALLEKSSSYMLKRWSTYTVVAPPEPKVCTTPIELLVNSTAHAQLGGS